MTFAHPAMLLGCLAALIPTVVHLFNRQRPKAHRFAAIAFVLRSHRRTVYQVRFRRFLLYLMRTLLLLAVPVALARPQMRTGATQLMPQGPQATILVLDASMSMQYSTGKSLFEVGKDLARRSLDAARTKDQVGLLVCSDTSTRSAPTFDRLKIKDAINSAQVGFARADLNRCLDIAAAELEKSPAGGKRLEIISDFTRSALNLNLPPPRVMSPNGSGVAPEMVIKNVAENLPPLTNSAVTRLQLEPSQTLGPGGYQFKVTLFNLNAQPSRDVPVTLVIDHQTVAKSFVDLPAHGTAEKIFARRFSEGGDFSGEVRLDADALPADNVYPFFLNVPSLIRVLVVNGSPSTSRPDDEAFFVEAALAAPGASVVSTVKDSGAAWREDFLSYDVVFLLNVQAPTPEVARRLSRFVDGGGGLFISMGDQVDPGSYNQDFPDLLPRALWLVKSEKTRLIEVDHSEFIFAPFIGPSAESLTGSRFTRYMLMEGASKPSAKILASFEDGTPAVIVRNHGRGKVLVYNATVGRTWTDFPLRPSFLPFIQRVARFLSQKSEQAEQNEVRVGRTAFPALTRPERAKYFEGPTGRRESGDSSPLLQPGLYRAFDSAGRKVPEQNFAVILHPEESDLSQIPITELQRYFKSSGASAFGSGDEPRAPWWRWLMVAAGFAFIVESVLS